MPHAVIHYSNNMSDTIKTNKVVSAIHQMMIDCGLFDAENIKTRAYATNNYLVGTKGNEGSFAHLTVSILAGRTTEQRKTLSESLLSALKNALPMANSLTVEIREMDKETYQKI